MSAQTKTSVLSAVFNFLDVSIKRIDASDMSAQDFKVFEEVMGYLGIKKEVFDETLKKYEFNSWEDFVNMRTGIYPDGARIDPIISYIHGLVDGAKDRISKELIESQNRPVPA